MDITFITGNEHKAKYVAQWLGVKLQHQKLDLDELQTLDLRELVAHKAKQAYSKIGSPVLVEDANLIFNALGHLPGPFIKFFVEDAGLEATCRMLDGFSDRTAHGDMCYALYDGKDMRFFEGTMTGTIADKPKGAGGFGFDPIFINDGQPLTRSEMSEQTYADTSYRKIALDKLAECLHAQA